MVNDTDLTTLGTTRLDKFRGKNIGIIFQTAHFIKALSVFENLALAQNLIGEKTDKNLIINTLDQLNLAQKLYAKPQNLSVGEAQ
ncbi:MAG: ABC transporter ATP-binding protein, partial [Saprospiraceae bacterium]|nr:ABC transporter ATP-binding protein [Saprospiraceae bacterium]